MTQSQAPASEWQCPYQPSGETTLRCAKCARPLMVKDARRTPIGYVCPEYVKGRRATFFNAKGYDYPLTAILALLGGVISTVIFSLIGDLGIFAIYLLIPAGPVAGGIVAEVLRRLLKKRRGQWSWLVAVVAFGLGALIVLGAPTLYILARTGMLVFAGSLVALIGVGTAIATLVARLRL
ncbi:MAG: hypothetical protein K1X39_09050 [Thermoflexales bacterium]|nr:hypothetical protein [Thermoflexales bacterium]